MGQAGVWTGSYKGVAGLGKGGSHILLLTGRFGWGDTGPESSKFDPNPTIQNMFPKVPGGPQALPKIITCPFGPFLDLLGPFGPFGPFWNLLALLGHFGPFGPFWTLWPLLDPFGLFWPFSAILDHFCPFRPGQAGRQSARCARAGKAPTAGRECAWPSGGEFLPSAWPSERPAHDDPEQQDAAYRSCPEPGGV